MEEQKSNSWEKFYADAVKGHGKITCLDGKVVNLPLVGFLFGFKQVLWNDETDAGQLFVNTWLKSHYDLYNDFWKSTEVPEILEQEKIQEKVV